jgi:hypothetical protein
MTTVAVDDRTCPLLPAVTTASAILEYLQRVHGWRVPRGTLTVSRRLTLEVTVDWNRAL